MEDYIPPNCRLLTDYIAEIAEEEEFRINGRELPPAKPTQEQIEALVRNWEGWRRFDDRNRLDLALDGAPSADQIRILDRAASELRGRLEVERRGAMRAGRQEVRRRLLEGEITAFVHDQTTGERLVFPPGFWRTAKATAILANGLEGIERVFIQFLPAQLLRVSSDAEAHAAVRSSTANSSASGIMTSAIYAPDGYRPMEDAYEEFVRCRFVAELKRHWEAYARIVSDRGTLVADILDGGALRPVALEEADWHRRIEGQFLSSDDGDRRDAEKSARGNWGEMLIALRNGEGARHVNEDRDMPRQKTAYEICLELLAGGCSMFLESNKAEIIKAFRSDFVDERRRAFALGENGDLTSIPASWWRGPQCGGVLESRQFVHSGGVILEKLLAAHETNTADQRRRAALEWLVANADRVASMTDANRRQHFTREASTSISNEGWKRAKDDLLRERPDLKPAFTRSGPRGKRR